MNTTVHTNRFSGRIKAISSKSLAHRHIICNALSDKDSEIICNGISDDIFATCDCISSLGGKTTIENNRICISPVSNTKKTAILNCRESGTTLRLMLPVVGALGIYAQINATGRLPQRPLSPLYEILSENGCDLSENGLYPLYISGQLKGNSYSVPGNVSSQFISGLLLALPLIGGGTVEVTGRFESESYVDMTVNVMKEHGITVERKKNLFRVFPGKYIAKDLTVEGDWSNNAFWIAAGILGGNVEIEGLKQDSPQGDREIIDIVKRFGGNVRYKEGTVYTSSSSLKGIEIDAKNIPDLVPVLAVIASNAAGITVIKNIERLRLKESDRIQSTVEMINNLGGRAIFENNQITITGNTEKKPFSGGAVDSYNDHRIVMASAVASVLSENPVTINSSQAKNKSYPAFFDDFVSLGGIIKD